MLYCELEQEHQENLFAFLGDSLNETIYGESKNSYERAQDLGIGQLQDTNIIDLYKTCDKRVCTRCTSRTTFQDQD